MLIKLTISNYALINELSVEFSKGLNTVTGETGAGKSIILGALGLILGNRADLSVLKEKSKCFVPAHPIAGKEKSGFEVSVSDLFEDKKVILTPLENNAPESIKVIHDMWTGLGSEVDYMSSESHDELLGMTSHLPHMLAFSLVNYLISKNPSASIYAAGGFKDFSRIASGDAVMWRDICIQNKDQIIDHIRGYQKTLNSLVDAIENENSDELDLLFDNGNCQLRDEDCLFMQFHTASKLCGTDLQMCVKN